MAGLKRVDVVYLNRLQRDYSQDKLPNPEQVRFDFARMISIVTYLNDEIEQINKRQV